MSDQACAEVTSTTPNDNMASSGVDQQQQETNYANVAAKTVANIRRLQENVLSVNISSSANNVSTVSVGTPVQPPDDSSICQQTPPESPLPSISPSLASSFNALVTIDPNWQSSKTTLRERNKVMCNNALMADIYFMVGSEALAAQMSDPNDVLSNHMPKKIPAHKYVLATGSTVFYAMFYGGLSDPSAETIDVPDVDPDAFLVMLKYLYCDEIDLNADNVLATLYAAKKYLVPQLASACVRYLEHSLTARNACLLLSQARLFAEPALTERAWEVIDAQAELALTSEAFADIDFATLESILGRETLNCRETVVFEAAINWAAAECNRKNVDGNCAKNKRSALGKAMNLIRFPAMSVADFADTVALSDMLTLKETNDIFLYFTAKQKPDLPYECRPRKGLSVQICHRFGSSAYRSNQWRYRGRCDAIQFCVDKRVFIVGFGFYGSSNGSSDYSARIELKTNGGRLLATNSQKFFSDGSSNTFSVFFDQPVQVEPDTYYTASAVLDGAELSYFGQEGMSEVSIGNVNFQFQCSSESTNGTGVQGGQIPELIFYGPTVNPPIKPTEKAEIGPNCQLVTK